jgi:hypothetical protein
MAVTSMTYEPRLASKTLYLRIAPGLEGALKVVWSVKALLAQYEVSEDHLKAQAARVREQLEKIVIAKINNDSIGPTLKQLAREGKALYDQLFRAVDTSGEPQKVRQWLASAGAPLLINITVSTLTRIPWCLLYEGDPEAIPDDADPMDFTDYGGFWGLKHLVSCLHQRIREITDQRSDFKVFPVVHNNEFNKVHAQLPLEEQSRINSLLQKFGGNIERSEDLYARWKKAGATDRILLFYCHANGGTLALSANDSISTSDFGIHLDYADQWPDTVTLTFLNGCSTAVGQATKGFLEATGQRGFIGFVGTEAKVPNMYALRFGTEFVECFLETGWPLVTVMDAMWRLHWPLSVLYSLNGFSDVKLTRPQVIQKWPSGASIAPSNFSNQPIGTSSL